jgi:hypothetical protein
MGDLRFYIVLDWKTGKHLRTVETQREALECGVDGACYYHVFARNDWEAVRTAQRSWRYDQRSLQGLEGGF